MLDSHTINDEFRTIDKVRRQVVDTILIEGLALLGTGASSEVLEVLLLDLHLARSDADAFESWSDQDLPLALDECPSDIRHMTMTRLAQPGLSQLFDSLGPLRDRLLFVDDDRKGRLAPVLLRAVPEMLNADVVVVPVGLDGVGELSSEILDTFRPGPRRRRPG